MRIGERYIQVARNTSRPIFTLLLLMSTAACAWAETAPIQLPLPASVHDAAQWKEQSGTWSLGDGGHALRGGNGLLFSQTIAPAEFSLTIRIRYDALRYFARPPFSGIAFHVVDQKNYDAVVLANDECQLAWKQVRNGHEKVIATSRQGLYTEVGQPFWMRVTIASGAVEGSLSLDGHTWKTVLHQALADSAVAGRVGLIAGLPETWFSWGSDAEIAMPAYQPYRYEVHREPPASIANAPTRADYLKVLQAMKNLPVDTEGGLPEQGLASLRAWQVTHDEVWKQRSILAARKMIAEYNSNGTVPIGFASFYQEMTTLQAAMSNQWLTDAERSVVPRLAAEALTRGQYERGPMNRALGNLVGIKPALTLAPEYVQRAQVEKIVKLVEQDFASYGYAPIEDASDYIKVSLQFAAIHALESHPDWWQQKGFHDVFLNFAAMISPLGRFPGFGDDDDANPPELMGLLELAAAKWGDPVFHEAARRLWAVSYGRSMPASVKSAEISGVALAAMYASEKPQPALRGETAASVLYRADGDPTKAILHNGSTWMMVDLFAGGEHGHNDSLAVTTMESNGTVQLEDNGRYARGMMFHNRPQFVLHAEDFPLRHDLTEQTRRIRQNYFDAGEWTFYHLPLHDHWIWGNFAGAIGLPTLQRDAYNPEIPAALSYDPASQTALVLDLRGYGEGLISIADARITDGSTSRPLKLDIPAGAPPAQIQPAAFRGSDVYTWKTSVAAQNTFVGGVAQGSTDAAAARHTWLDFWLRAEPVGDSRIEINSIALGDRDGYPKRWIDDLSPNGQTSVDATETVDGGAHLIAHEVMLSQQDEPVRFTRDIYMALPGFTWVRDTTENDGTHAGVGGVLWYGVNPAAAGIDRFHFATGLDVIFSGATATGIDTRQTYGMRDEAIAFASAPLAAQGTTMVDSMLITGAAKWRCVLKQGRAVVWSDGVHWVGRNPDGLALRLGGQATNSKLFVLTNQAVDH